MLVAALAAVALATAGGVWMQWTAAQRLSAAEIRTNALLGEIAALSEVRQAAALEKELTGYRDQAMATDLAWPGMVGSVHDVLPENVVIVGFDLTAGAIAQGEDPALEIGAIGTFTFESPTPVEIVALIRAVRVIPGVMGADGWELTSEDEDPRVYTYLLRTTFDQTAYSGEYAEGASR
jgi:hypothetical protein